MNIFKLELKRAIFNKRMLIVLLFGVALVLYYNITNFMGVFLYVFCRKKGLTIYIS